MKLKHLVIVVGLISFPLKSSFSVNNNTPFNVTITFDCIQGSIPINPKSIVAINIPQDCTMANGSVVFDIYGLRTETINFRLNKMPENRDAMLLDSASYLLQVKGLRQANEPIMSGALFGDGENGFAKKTIGASLDLLVSAQSNLRALVNTISGYQQALDSAINAGSGYLQQATATGIAQARDESLPAARSARNSIATILTQVRQAIHDHNVLDQGFEDQAVAADNAAQTAVNGFEGLINSAGTNFLTAKQNLATQQSSAIASALTSLAGTLANNDFATAMQTFQQIKSARDIIAGIGSQLGSLPQTVAGGQDVVTAINQSLQSAQNAVGTASSQIANKMEQAMSAVATTMQNFATIIPLNLQDQVLPNIQKVYADIKTRARTTTDGLPGFFWTGIQVDAVEQAKKDADAAQTLLTNIINQYRLLESPSNIAQMEQLVTNVGQKHNLIVAGYDNAHKLADSAFKAVPGRINAVAAAIDPVAISNAQTIAKKIVDDSGMQALTNIDPILVNLNYELRAGLMDRVSNNKDISDDEILKTLQTKKQDVQNQKNAVLGAQSAALAATATSDAAIRTMVAQNVKDLTDAIVQTMLQQETRYNDTVSIFAAQIRQARDAQPVVQTIGTGSSTASKIVIAMDNGFPQGPWRNYCGYWNMQGSILSARCKTNLTDADYQPGISSLDITTCVAGQTVNSCDGKLSCGSPVFGCHVATKTEQTALAQLQAAEKVDNTADKAVSDAKSKLIIEKEQEQTANGAQVTAQDAQKTAQENYNSAADIVKNVKTKILGLGKKLVEAQKAQKIAQAADKKASTPATQAALSTANAAADGAKKEFDDAKAEGAGADKDLLAKRKLLTDANQALTKAITATKKETADVTKLETQIKSLEGVATKTEALKVKAQQSFDEAKKAAIK